MRLNGKILSIGFLFRLYVITLKDKIRANTWQESDTHLSSLELCDLCHTKMGLRPDDSKKAQVNFVVWWICLWFSRLEFVAPDK